MIRPARFLRNPNKGGSFQHLRDGMRYDATWQRFARRYLVGHPICHCDAVKAWKDGSVITVPMGAAGMVAPSELVDHIRPLNAGGERFDPANLQPLCRLCHSRKTHRFG